MCSLAHSAASPWLRRLAQELGVASLTSRRSVSTWWASLIVVALSASTDCDAHQKARFLLIPEDRWSTLDPAAPERSAVSEGSVLLYSQGSYEPSHVLPTNEEVTVPPGHWSWSARGPGYVSTSSGMLDVPERQPIESAARTFVWPVAPACRVGPDPGVLATGRAGGHRLLDARQRPPHHAGACSDLGPVGSLHFVQRRWWTPGRDRQARRMPAAGREASATPGASRA